MKKVTKQQFYLNKVFRSVFKNPVLTIALIWIAFLCILKPNFISTRNIVAILRQTSIIGILACGLMFVQISGDIDLSMGAFASFGNVLFAVLSSSDYFGLSSAGAFFITLGVCFILGGMKGALIIFGHIPSAVATFGLAFILKGVNSMITDAKIISNIDQSIAFLGQGYIGSLPCSVLLFALIAILAGIVLKWTYFGRYVYAIGMSSRAAELAGIKVKRVRIYAHVISAMAAGIGGIVLCCRVLGGQATAGDSYQMTAILACALGGVSFSGGRGSIWGVLCGIIMIGLINNGLTMLNVGNYLPDIILGTTLIIAVGIDYLRHVKTGTKS